MPRYEGLLKRRGSRSNASLHSPSRDTGPLKRFWLLRRAFYCFLPNYQTRQYWNSTYAWKKCGQTTLLDPQWKQWPPTGFYTHTHRAPYTYRTWSTAERHRGSFSRHLQQQSAPCQASASAASPPPTTGDWRTCLDGSVPPWDSSAHCVSAVTYTHARTHTQSRQILFNKLCPRESTYLSSPLPPPSEKYGSESQN